MIKLVLDKNGSSSLFRSHNSFKGFNFREMSNIIKDNIRQGTKIQIFSDNSKPEPHRGNYYLLYMQEYQSVYLFYLDVKGVLRIVHSGDIYSAVSAIYRYVSNDTNVVVLKSDSKRAYRVAKSVGGEWQVQQGKYKNKSSQIVPQVYMNFFEAINLAVYNYKNDKRAFSYAVLSPKNTVMFFIDKN